MIKFDKADNDQLNSLKLNEFRLVFIVYSNIGVEFDELKRQLSLSENELRQRLTAVQYFVSSYFSPTSGNIAIISKAVSTKYLKCSGCHYVKLVGKAYKCKLPISDMLMCNDARKAYLLEKELIKKGFKKSHITEIKNRDVENVNFKEKSLKDWSTLDFARLLKELYQPYDHLLGGTNNILQKRFVKLRKIFIVEFADEADGIGWKYYLKRYLVWYFKNIAKQVKNPSLYAMCEIDNLKKFIEEVPDAKFCSKHGLFCPYVGKCKKRVDCNDDLRKRIKERYN